MLVAMLALTVFVSCDDKKENNDPVSGAPTENDPVSVAPTEYDINTENTDYGLWWYDNDGEDGVIVRASADLPLEYYDPSKPTVVYSHGWKSKGEEEVLSTTEETIDKGIMSEDYAKALKRAGYNVAYFKWNEYARELLSLHELIWNADFAPDQDAADKVITAKEALGDKSLAGEFAREFITSMQDYKGGDIYFVGHSFGCEMVVAAAYTLTKMNDEELLPSADLIPSRLILADPYIPGEKGVLTSVDAFEGKMDGVDVDLSDRDCANVFADALKEMADKGVAFADIYCGMDMAFNAHGGDQGVLEKLISGTRYILMKGLRSSYGSVGAIHNITRDWALMALVDGLRGEEMSFSPAPSMTADELPAAGSYTMMGGFIMSAVNIVKD